MHLTPSQAASILLDRRKARRSLEAYAARIPVPGSPMSDIDENAAIPLIESTQAEHHKIMLDAMQECMETPHGRLMIMAPPGSAKSTYATVVGPSWYLGRNPGKKVILASYGGDLAKRHGRRTRQLLRAPETEAILECSLNPESRAADDFALTNGSEYIACGILGGITGNRANGIVIDDPIKGRAESDSQVVRDTTYAAYEDDLLTRLIPGGWVVIIQTRWHEDDISGRILPADWNGESGQILCRDGNTWQVLCLQAECTTRSDPLRREIGEMLWPEWFDKRHWDQFRSKRRTWSSLYQQIPAPAEGILFRKNDMATYEVLPRDLRIIGASDKAVTPEGGDWTEHGIIGVAKDGSAYLIDWWRGQVSPDVWIERELDMMAKHKPLAWFDEAGPIEKATKDSVRRRMRERTINCRLETLPSVSDKATRAQSIIALAGMGRLFWPTNAAWVPELQRQCLVFPAGSPDDGVDALSLLGRGAATLGMYEEDPEIVVIPRANHFRRAGR